MRGGKEGRPGGNGRPAARVGRVEEEEVTGLGKDGAERESWTNWSSARSALSLRFLRSLFAFPTDVLLCCASLLASRARSPLRRRGRA